MASSQEMTPVDRTVIDTPERLVAYLENARASGRLISHSRATAVGTDRFAVKVRTLDPPPAKRAVSRPTVLGEMGRALAFVGFVMAAVALAGVALYFAVRNAFDAATVAQLGGGIFVGSILLFVLANRANHSGACPGIAVHCKGCRH